MQNEEPDYEYAYFWEVDGIYDLDGDLLIWSLMGVAIVSMEETLQIANFLTDIEKELWKEMQS